MITVKPLKNMVLLRVLPVPPRSSILATPGDVVTRSGVIEATGPECRYAEVGQTVLFHSLLGHELGDNRLLAETDLLATL